LLHEVMGILFATGAARLGIEVLESLNPNVDQFYEDHDAVIGAFVGRPTGLADAIGTENPLGHLYGAFRRLQGIHDAVGHHRRRGQIEVAGDPLRLQRDLARILRHLERHDAAIGGIAIGDGEFRRRFYLLIQDCFSLMSAEGILSQM